MEAGIKTHTTVRGQKIVLGCETMQRKNVLAQLRGVIRQRRMFWRILLLYLIGSALLLAAFSAALTQVLTQRAIDEAIERNRDSLSQAYQMADYALNTTYDTYYKLYQSYEAAALMFAPERAQEDALAVDRIFRRMDCASDCVDSIYLINRTADRVYSSDGRISGLEDFFDGQALRLFQFYSENSNTLFLPRTATFSDVSGSQLKRSYITLIFSQRGKFVTPMGGLMVNINEADLMERITGSLETPENFYLLSENGSILANSDAGLVNTSIYGSPLWNQVTAHSGQEHFSFREDFNGQECLVTGRNAPRLRFCFLCITPVARLRDSVSYIRNIVVLCSAIFLAVALFMSTAASRWIYRPISRLVTHLRDRADSDKLDEETGALPPSEDEITFLGNTYQGLFEKVSTLSQDHHVMERARRREVLLRLFYGEYPSEEVCRKEAGQVGLPLDSPMEAVVILFDDYERFSRENGTHDLALYRYGLSNMAEELLEPHGSVFCAESNTDQITLLFCPGGESEEQAAQAMQEALHTFGEAVRQYINCSVSCGIGTAVNQMSELVTSYNQAMTASGYRLVFGCGAVIPYETIATRQSITPEYPVDTDAAIVQALRSRNVEKASAGLDTFFGQYALANVDAINMAVTQLTISLSRTVHSLAAGHEGTRQLPNYRVLSELLSAKDTLKERKAVLQDYCEQVIDIRNNESQTKKEDLIERVRAFIDTNYANPLLSTEEIAAYAELSPNYLRTLFKNAMGKSPTDYLTECRLIHACDLLVSTDTSTKEIAAAVGYYNHRYFYSVFKSKIGMTATAYRNKMRNRKHPNGEEAPDDERE